MTARHRIAVLGTPSRPLAPWDATTLAGLARDGFTGVQLNIAWSYRPADEPLNLEDVWDVVGAPVAGGDPSRVDLRRAELADRAGRARAAGLRTLFHIGMPYQGRAGFDGVALPQCISDPETAARYVRAVREFAAAFPDVDDLLLYTYDQDAWLCDEFGECPRCSGVPLHRRLPAFLIAVARAWRAARPEGLVWWEPWELSAGQALTCIPRLAEAPIGLMLHSSIAEVITTMPGDRFLVNAARAAAEAGLPVVVEVFLSSSNEEVEPWRHLPVPLVTVRQLREVERIPGVVGIKEYFGLQPHDADVNLAAARIYLRDPAIADDALLDELSGHAPGLAEFWARSSRAYEVYPWDASWFVRQLGRSVPAHELSAATVRGAQSGASLWETPAWRSTRASMFMRTDNSEPHPWLAEDVGLRFAEAADLMEDALAMLDAAVANGLDVDASLQAQRSEAEGFVTRARANALHLRESALCALLRRGSPRTPELLVELRDLLVEDRLNQEREERRALGAPVVEARATPLQLAERWIVADPPDLAAIGAALDVLDRDPDAFLATYFLPGPAAARWGQFSVTSR